LRFFIFSLLLVFISVLFENTNYFNNIVNIVLDRAFWGIAADFL